MPNTIGGARQIEISKLLFKSKMIFFSHVSEGMYRLDDIDEFIWGRGKEDKNLLENLSMLWSNNAFGMSVNKYPYLKDKFRVSGAVGFDKYSILESTNLYKTDIFKNTIGYAAFDFHNIISKESIYRKNLGNENYNNLIKQADIANKILKNLILNNKETLFLLKAHPGDGDNKIPLEFAGVLEYPNVKLLSRKISIYDAVSNSDIWLNINSSTNMEAWILGKPSISFINEKALHSSDVIEGSIIENNISKINNYVNEYFENGTIKEFDKKSELRKKLIDKYIGFSDGLNHVRYMSFLKPYIDNIEKVDTQPEQWTIPFKTILKGQLQKFLYSIAKNKYKIPILKKWAEYYTLFSMNELSEKKKRFYKSMDAFYGEHKDKIDSLYNNYSKEFNNKYMM